MALGGCSDTYLRRGLGEDLICYRSNLTRTRCAIFFDTLAAETYYQSRTVVESVYYITKTRQQTLTTGSHRERRAFLGTSYILIVLFYDSQDQYINCFFVVQRGLDITIDNTCTIYSKEAPCHRGAVY